MREVAHVEQRPQGCNCFGNFCRRHAIAQINRFQNQFFIVAPLGLVVRGNENRGLVDRFPERTGLQCKDVKSFVDIHPGQFDWNSCTPKVRIKNDIEPGELRKRFEHHAAVLTGHMDVNGACDLGFELRLDTRICPGIPSQLVEQNLWFRLVLASVRQNFIHLGQLLLG